jgi:hypothetical protein
MKKAIFSTMALLLVCASLSSFGQKTNTEIYNTIQMSKEYNSLHGIKNPNQIWPGQVLTFLFQDGSWQEVVVESGDSQWTIVQNKLDKFQKEHGQVVSPDTIIPQPILIQPITPEPLQLKWWEALSWGWLLLAIAVLVIAIKLLEIRYNSMRQDPVTAGPPQVFGGVKDNEAYSRMNQIAQNRFPGAQIVIKNIRRGWLSGWAQVFYASDKTKRLKLKDVASYAGEAMINGREQTIYFLQGCGNDARQGNYMTGDLDFREDVIINRDGSESPLPVVETPAPEVITEEEPVDSPISLGSELFQIAGEHALIVEEFLKNNVAHKVTMEYTTPKGGVVKTVFETKNEVIEKK